MIQVPIWAVVLVAAVVALLALLSWSALRGRKTRVVVGDVAPIPDGLPAIVGVTHGVLMPGNSVRILRNGEGFFPVLIAEIDAARETVNLETFVWGWGKVPQAVGGALAAAGRRGVAVRLLVDSIGAEKMESGLRDEMERAGCRIVRYRPVGVSKIAWINARDHRKVAVVDGRVGFVMGHGISEEWGGNADGPGSWRDTGARIEGPIVGALQSVFSENWLDATGEAIAGEEFFPELQPAGRSTAHVAYHFQHGSVSSVALLYRLAIQAARSRLTIQTPYLVPDRDYIEALVAAAGRGVDVRVMVPGEITDSKTVRHASHRLYAPLLAGGVRLWEYRRTLNHQKIMVVDGVWSHIGSTNLDNRSLESSDEVSLGVLDERVAAELEADFEADRRDAEEITLDGWRARGAGHKVRDFAAYLLNEFL